MKTLLYIHGFNSSPSSEKARLTRAFFDTSTLPFDVTVASFPSEPGTAIERIESHIEAIGASNLAGFIGSSLGGYYSVYLHWRYGLPAVLINPAMRPYELLRDYLGVNQNPYTGECYRVTEAHMQQLLDIDRADRVDQSRLYLLTQLGDEVLDAQQALSTFSAAKCWVQAGGDHAFQNFSDCLPSIATFFADLSPA